LLDLDRVAALRLQRLDLVVFDADVLALRDLVAAHDLILRHFFAGHFRNLAIADAPAGLGFELVEADVLAARRGDHAHRHLHQAEADRTRPNRAGHRASIVRGRRAAARPCARFAYTGAVMAAQVHVSVDGRELVLSNLEKVLYPDAAFTKADVIDYYRRIA